MSNFIALRRLAAVIPALLWWAPAHAQSEPQSQSAPASTAPTGFWTRSNLLGDMGGLRSTIGNEGITLNVTDTESLLGNVAGGVKQGATLQGLTLATLQIDTGKAFGLQGGSFNVSALQIHGRSLSPYYLDNLQAANGTEADDATRLWELWYDQQFGQNLDLKLGQQSIDQEFITSKYTALFVNTMAGWPLVPSVDLYAGGPAYPLSSLGARVQVKANSRVTFLAGVYDDNPSGGPFADDPQSRDDGGTRFNLNTGALFIAEAQVAASPFGQPATYKLGFWYDTGSFPDQAIDDQGLSLANPASNGNPAMHKGNYSVYGVIDQTLWQPKDSARSVNAFARIMGAPAAQNLVGFFFNGGLTLTDPLPGRDNDSAGIDLGVGHVSGQASDLDHATAFYSGIFTPIRGTETLVELTYQAQITPWLLVQPDVQFVLNPGGGILNPSNPAERLHDEIVAGIHTTITF
jgi:porin